VSAHPASTVVVLRPCAGAGGGAEFEALLLRRDSRLAFHGGHWVFPGGRVDREDRERAQAGPQARDGGEPSDDIGAARHAGSREVAEEAGLRVDPKTLIPLSHWTTPDGLPRKFATWFFVARVDQASNVRVDDAEIREYRWQTPRDALADQRNGEIVLPGPTFVTLTWLSEFLKLDEVLAHFRDTTPPFLLPRPILCEGGRVSLLPGDAGYASGNLAAPGPRHRTWFLDTGWRYERCD